MINIDQPPIRDDIVEGKSPNRTWLYWFNSLFRAINDQGALLNTHLLLNPDFHWSRTTGNTPLTADGSFVEQWNIKSNGMTFAATPTYYTSTTDSSLTGSDRFVNMAISSPNSNEFSIYQTQSKGLSLLQNKTLTFSASLRNNIATELKAKFYIGFDTNNDGIDEHNSESRIFTIPQGFKNLFVSVKTPKITTDNQTNNITYALKLQNLSGIPNFNLYYIKPELSGYQTSIYVDHTLEKLRIDNK
jgi:hypothetical protein